MDKCQFCGASADTDAGSLYRYQCRSTHELRGRLCYERQITTLKERLTDSENIRSLTCGPPANLPFG